MQYFFAMLRSSCIFHHPASPEIYALSLHDALPILTSALVRPCGSVGMNWWSMPASSSSARARLIQSAARPLCAVGLAKSTVRSEEHTSELQSQSNLVCRLLLEKKKIGTGPCMW